MSKYQPLIWITDDYLFHMKYASLKDSNGRTAYTYFIDEREKGTFYLRLIAFVPYTFSSLKPKIAERATVPIMAKSTNVKELAVS